MFTVRRFFVFFSFLSFIHSSSFLQSSRDSDYNCTFVLENNEEIQNQVHISNETLSFSFFWIVPSLLVRAYAIISHLWSFTQLSWLLCRIFLLLSLLRFSPSFFYSLAHLPEYACCCTRVQIHHHLETFLLSVSLHQRFEKIQCTFFSFRVKNVQEIVNVYFHSIIIYFFDRLQSENLWIENQKNFNYLELQRIETERSF